MDAFNVLHLEISENLTWLIFTARRYASAVYAVVMCLSVRPSVTSRYCMETTGRTELVLGMEAPLKIPHHTLHMLPRNRVKILGTRNCHVHEMSETVWHERLCQIGFNHLKYSLKKYCLDM